MYRLQLAAAMIGSISRFLGSRPVVTLAGLRALWLLIVIDDVQGIVFAIAIRQQWIAESWTQSAINLAGHIVPLVLDLVVLRVLLEIACVILVPTTAEHQASNAPEAGPIAAWRLLLNLVVLNPILTANALRLVWLATLTASLAGILMDVSILAAEARLDLLGIEATRFLFWTIVQPIILLALVRVAVEVASRVLPRGAEPDPGVRKINILLIGSGGREHALAWKLAQSPKLAKLYAAPGNPGIAEHAELVALDIADHPAVATFCRENGIDLVVVGPEGPLVAGIADDLAAFDIPVFGPSREAARLEGSKGYTKALCAEAGIPTAAWARFDDAAAARAHATARRAPMVVKADGLAAGKGVTVAMNLAEALAAIDDCFAGLHGTAGASVVIEDFLEGEEASFFVLSDGIRALPLATAQDHKRAHDGDTGPNTGGMGAYSPAPAMTPDLVARTMAEIVEPTLATMRARGAPFRGVLYAGLMLTAEGPKLIEYNVRFGDPETQVLMMRLDADLVALLAACAAGDLSPVTPPTWRDDAALTVVMAARGYPGAYEKGSVIRGIERADAIPGVKVFHAGTALRDGEVVATGGRVLNVTALGATIAAAQGRAYEAVDVIDWPDGFARRDIGWRAV